MVLSRVATFCIFTGIGLVGGHVINKPVYGAARGGACAVVTVALEALFGPKGYYASIALLSLWQLSQIGQWAQEQQTREGLRLRQHMESIRLSVRERIISVTRWVGLTQAA